MLLYVVVTFSNIIIAQEKSIEITGTIVESQSKKPVEFATVMLKDKATKKNIDGSTTSTDGSFKIRTNSSEYLKYSLDGLIDEARIRLPRARKAKCDDQKSRPAKEACLARPSKVPSQRGCIPPS